MSLHWFAKQDKVERTGSGSCPAGLERRPQRQLGRLRICERDEDEILARICTGGEYVELLSRDVVESRDVSLEVLRQHLLRHVLKPVCELNTTKSALHSRDVGKC